MSSKNKEGYIRTKINSGNKIRRTSIFISD